MPLSFTDILVPKYEPRITDGVSHKPISYLTPPITMWVADPARVVMTIIRADVAIELCIGMPKSKFIMGTFTTPPPMPRSPLRKPAMKPKSTSKSMVLGSPRFRLFFEIIF